MPTTPKMSRRSSYTQEALQEAILAVDQGMTVTAAAKQFSIPRQTLKDKISGKYALECKMGRPSILTPDEEKVLVDWVVSVGAAGFPISKDQILSSVQKLMANLNRENPFSGTGGKWFSLFLQRHQEISARVSQALTTSRAAVTEAHIKQWFAEVKEYIKSKNIEDVFKDPSRIFNCDETAFFLCPKGKKVYVKKGEKHVYNITGNDEKECLTTLIMANGAGDLAPPMVVFSYERVPASVVMKFPETWGIGKSESGWMTGETFFEFVSNVFYPWLVNKNIPRPVVLFVDGHNSHLTLHLSEFCSSKQIELISLYPNATHILQPLDVAVFHPVKECWKKTVEKWRCDNGAAKIKKDDFAPLLKTVLETSIKPETIKSGFSCTGLLSLDPGNVNFFKKTNTPKKTAEEIRPTISYGRLLALRSHLAYLESKIGQDRLDRFKQEIITNEETALFEVWKTCYEETIGHQGTSPTTDHDRPSQLEHTEESPLETGQAEAVVLASVSNENDIVTIPFDEDLFSNNWNTDFPLELDIPISEIQAAIPETPPNAKPSTSQSCQESVCSSEAVSIHNGQTQSYSQITPVKSISKHQNDKTETLKPVELQQKVPTPFKKALFWPGESQSKKRKLKKVRLPSAVTSEEWKTYYKQLEEKKKAAQEDKEKRKEMRELKAKIKKEKEENKKGTKRKLIETDEDEDLVENELQEKQMEEALELDLEALRPSMWVVVPYTVGSEEKMFVGQILSISDEDSVNIKFLEKKIESDKYIWPKTDDIDCVSKNDIVRLLREPTFDRWGYLTFSDI